ncbi:hypothetical protein N9N08_00110 [bacterium]|nr:hypothetical protein [bacterium]
MKNVKGMIYDGTVKRIKNSEEDLPYIPPVIIDDFFSEDILNLFEKYTQWNPEKDDPTDYWPDEATEDKDIIKVEDMSRTDETLIREFLYTNLKSPFKNNRQAKHTSFNIVKAEPNYILGEHRDECSGSMTAFIDKKRKVGDNLGGEFYYKDDKGNKHIVEHKYNRVIIIFNGGEGFVSPLHGTIVNKIDRFTLQMFIR